VSKQYVVRWTWEKHRIVKTKKRALEACKAWRAWKERQGWRTRSATGGDGGYVAYSPDYESDQYCVFGPGSKLQVCIIEVYENQRRVWPKLPPLRDPAIDKPKIERKTYRRRGRKPIGA
jgi:hypothetical protein